MRKVNAHRLPPRPIHLYAELISAEHDGIGITSGCIMLHLELEKATPTVPLSFSVPDGETHSAAICITDGNETGSAELIEGGYAVFTLERGDALSLKNLIRSGYRTRKPDDAEILAWVILRVTEYVTSRHDIAGGVVLLGDSIESEHERISELCGL